MATNPYMAQPGQNLGMGAPTAMRNDWNSYFDGAKAGSSTNWGGGTLTMGDNGEAKYAAQGALNGGNTLNRNSIDNPNTLQSLMGQAPGIAKQWGDQYGIKSGLNENDQRYFDNAIGSQQASQGGNQPQSQFGGQASGQSQNLGMSGGQQPQQPGMNPYIQQQAQALQAQSNQNLKQNVLPGIGQGAQAAGMYGSSRQGTAEGIAMGNAQTGLDSAVAGMYSNAYNQDQNSQLQRQGMSNQMSIAGMQNNTNMRGQDQSYSLGNKQADNSYGLGQGNLTLGNKSADQNYGLGMGNLGISAQNSRNSYDLGLRSNDLGFAGLDANINQNNFNNKMTGANFGLGIYDRMNGYNQQGTGNGTQMQNTPLNYFNQFNGNTMAAAGTGSPNVVAQQGNVLGAGVGAGMATYGGIDGYLRRNTGP